MPTVQRTTVIANRRPTSTEVMSKAQREASFTHKSLPATDKVRKAGVALDQTWGDENIMSGVAGALTGKLSRSLTSAQASQWATDMLATGLSLTDGKVRTRGEVTTKSSAVDAKTLTALSTIIAGDGFCYDTSNPANVTQVRKEIAALVTSLGSLKDLKLVQAQREVKVGDNDWRTATVSILVNTKTNTYAGFYTRGGWDA